MWCSEEYDSPSSNNPNEEAYIIDIILGNIDDYDKNGKTKSLYDALYLSSDLKDMLAGVDINSLSMVELSLYREAMDDFNLLLHNIHVMVEFPTTYHILLSLEERLAIAAIAIDEKSDEEVSRLKSCIDGFYKWVGSEDF